MVKVLFDHNMPPAMARSLHKLIERDGHEAWPLRDKFDQRIGDIDYFTQLGNDADWVVISKDRQNHKRTAERNAIMSSNVLAFYLSPATMKQSMYEQAATIAWHWEKIVVQRKTLRNGMFELPVNKGSKFKAL